MLHFVPDSHAAETIEPYAEAVARLASIRHALTVVDQFGGGPAGDMADDERIAAAWPKAPQAAKRCFERRSNGTICAATAGLEALVEARSQGFSVSPATAEVMSRDLRDSLADLAKLLRA